MKVAFQWQWNDLKLIEAQWVGYSEPWKSQAISAQRGYAYIEASIESPLSYNWSRCDVMLHKAVISKRLCREATNHNRFISVNKSIVVRIFKLLKDWL